MVESTKLFAQRQKVNTHNVGHARAQAFFFFLHYMRIINKHNEEFKTH